MKFIRRLLGDPADRLEEQGDALRLAGCWREAAWFYGRALEGAPPGPRHERLAAREAEAVRAAFRQILDESESLAHRRLRSEALDALREADRFVRSSEEQAILTARRHGLDESPQAEPAMADGEDEGDDEPVDSARALERAFRDRLQGRPEADRRRFEALGADGRAGFVHLGQGDHAAAMEALEREMTVRPESWVARELMAQALEGLGRTDEACQQYDAAWRRAPDRHVLVLEIARLLRERAGRPEEALARIDEAARRHPPAPDTMGLHLERVFLRVELGREVEAVALLGELLEAPGIDRALLHFNRAGLHERGERFDEALDDLRRAVEEAPGNVLYLERSADLIFRARRDPEEALSLLDRALMVDAHDFAGGRGGLGTSPDRARLQFKAARILYLLDRIDDSSRRVEEALVVCHDPNVQEALLTLRRDIRQAQSGIKL